MGGGLQQTPSAQLYLQSVPSESSTSYHLLSYLAWSTELIPVHLYNSFILRTGEANWVGFCPLLMGAGFFKDTIVFW